jgi:cytochrome c biogenesis protein CcdA
MHAMLTTIKSMLESAGYGPVALGFSLVLGILSAIASACCTLPLLGAVAGASIIGKEDGRTALSSALLFMTGAVFALLAIGVCILFFGQGVIKFSGDYWKIAAGCLALLFGIGALGLFPFKIPMPKFVTVGKKAGTVASGFSGFIFGGTIAISSLPCNPGIFIILGAAVLEKHILWAILTLAAFAIGFSAPLAALVFGLAFGISIVPLKGMEKVIRITAGILLIAVALYLFYSY